MRISERTMNSFGYIGLSVLVVLALLTWLDYIPGYLRLPVFFLALTLLLIRLTLRLLAERTKRMNDQTRNEG
ncbi:MAG: hypothetical protein WB699_09670 [Bacteroidota bacterium]